MKSITLLSVVFLICIFSYESSMSQNDDKFKLRCNSVIQSSVTNFIINKRQARGIPDAPEMKYVITIADYSLSKKVLDYSISFIMNEYEVELVNPKAVIDVYNVEILVRIEEDSIASQFLNDLKCRTFIYVKPEEKELGKYEFKRIATYRETFEIVKIENKKVTVTPVIDEWKMDVKYYNSYINPMYKYIKVDTMSGDEWERRLRNDDKK